MDPREQRPTPRRSSGLTEEGQDHRLGGVGPQQHADHPLPLSLGWLSCHPAPGL
jgi:hypothetical protein